MGYLDELKKAVAAAFEGADNKNAIDNMVNINTLIKSAEDEQTQLMNKNKELIAAYKDAVLHPGVGKEPEPDATTIPTAPERLEFADFVAQAINK